MPRVGVIASFIIYPLLWAPKMKTKWVRVSSRVIGGLGAVPLVVLVPAMILGLALASDDPSTRTRSVRSTDGQEAILIYAAGFLGRDYTEVRMTRPGCCRHTRVF